MTPETIAELRRRHAALTPFAVRFLGRGPDGEPYITLACEDGTPLPEPAFDAVLLFAELAAAELPALLDAAAERERMREGRDDSPRDEDGWATPGQMWAMLLDSPINERMALLRAALRAMDAEHRCVVGFHHEAVQQRDALAAKVARVRALPAKHPAGGWYMTSMRDVRAALDEETQP